MISFMEKFHILLHLTNERDYLHAWAREMRVLWAINFEFSTSQWASMLKKSH